MEWLLMTAGGAAVAWIVERLMEALWNRWRRPRRPLTDVEVHRHHRWRFGIAAAFLAWLLLVLLLAGASALTGGLHTDSAVPLLLLGALAVYMARVTHRRWRRLKH
jgi:hypothetical protein